ncbi:MAG: NPCBM/NEW2 domain-containing protein [Planctomycetes bacterium]|nr:NPCBM/NEW2 domain-containing protein [Planctomycetota bacterium]
MYTPFVLLVCLHSPSVQGQVSIAALDLSAVEQEWGEPHADRSVEGHALSIGGKSFEHGLGTHASSQFAIALGGQATRFHALVGADDETLPKQGSIEFRVLGDGKELWKSGLLHSGAAAKEVDLPLAGVKSLLLLVEDGGDGNSYDHADWAMATIEAEAGATIQSLAAPREEAVVLTPLPGPEPHLHAASVTGVRPGHPFLYGIPATGDRPMRFSAENLPEGLTLDAATGRISGKLAEKGEYKVILTAKNARGTDERLLRIVCGAQIALTPPLGWNSWNCFAGAVDDAKVRSAADAMVASGLAQHGWTYINIDDCWEAGRDAKGNILCNEKFPDMQALGDYIHSKGLRFGIYSSPGRTTCAGFTASWEHEEQDAQTWASWGVDYVKYDWCSYDDIAKDHSLPELKKPYSVMRAALDKAPRDIVFSLCQYGMGDVWQWGAEVGGNCWRTTGDITDTWGSMAGIGFAQNGHEKFAGPGHWNDPDMLVVGKVGWGNLHPTKLTPNEQYTHISLWCLLCSPLLIGCDMAQLDAFTLNLLTNDEVLEVSQDPLGIQAARVAQNGETEVWAKKMEDGSLAVGLFNRGQIEAQVSVNWKELGLQGAQRVRDLWRQKDLGVSEGSFATSVARHGAALIRIFPAKKR